MKRILSFSKYGQDEFNGAYVKIIEKRKKSFSLFQTFKKSLRVV